MKKFLYIPSLILMMSLVFIGCQKPLDPLQDGTYEVTFDEPDPTGWKAFLILKIEDGSILEVTYDYRGYGVQEGILKSQDEAYAEAMYAVTGTKPILYIQKLEDALLTSQDPEKIDTISGATTSTRDFKAFVKEALNASRQGEGAPITLPQP